MNFIFVVQWLSRCNSEILHSVKKFFLNSKAILSKHVSIFLPRKYDVISQLHHLAVILWNYDRSS